MRPRTSRAMANIADAHAALQLALSSNHPALISAARAAVAKAEAEDDAPPSSEPESAPESAPASSAEAECAECEGTGKKGESECSKCEGSGKAKAEAEEGEDSADAKHAAAPGASKLGRLLATLGATSIDEALGKAAAAASALAIVEKLDKRVRKMEGERKAAKLDKLFADARRDGRVTKAEVGHLRKVYADRPTAELRAYLDAKPRVATTEHATESRAAYPAADGPVGIDLARPAASRAMQAFGVTPEQIAKRAAERGIKTTFPGAA